MKTKLVFNQEKEKKRKNGRFWIIRENIYSYNARKKLKHDKSSYDISF